MFVCVCVTKKNETCEIVSTYLLPFQMYICVCEKVFNFNFNAWNILRIYRDKQNKKN